MKLLHWKMILGATALPALATLAKADPVPLQSTDVLTLRDGQFYLGGGKFAEISFDKFDVLWQIWDGLEAQAKGDGGVKLQKAIARQDSALRDLHSMGFRTIRMFGMPFQKLSSIWPDENLRKQLFQAVDTALDLCEKNDIQADFSLGLAGFADGDDATTVSPLFTDPDSSERQQCYAYIDATVNRCKTRKGIAMWEISNEMTNQSDIGVWKGKLQPSLAQTAAFFNDAAERIKQDDPLRLVSTGGSILRPDAWHREHHEKLTPDTPDEYRDAYADYFAHSAIDVVDTHYYEVRQGGQELAPGDDGKPVMMTPKSYVEMIEALGKGVIFGEYATLPSGWEGKGKKYPGWPEGYHDASAPGWVQKAVNDIVAAQVPITYWWAYQSDRKIDQRANPVTISLETTPDLVKVIADGSRRLKASLGAQ